MMCKHSKSLIRLLMLSSMLSETINLCINISSGLVINFTSTICILILRRRLFVFKVDLLINRHRLLITQEHTITSQEVHPTVPCVFKSES